MQNRVTLLLMITALFIFATSYNISNAIAAQPRVDVAPDVAMKQMYQQVAIGNAEAVWDSLPASVQNKINHNTRVFAERMDPEVWGKLVGLFSKLDRVIKEKKTLMANSSNAKKMHPDIKIREKFFLHMAGMANTVHTSDIGSLEKMSKFDGRSFMKQSGSNLLKEFAAFTKSPIKGFRNPIGMEGLLTNSKITIIEQDGDEATLRIESPEKEPAELKFYKIEGKWLSKKMKDQLLANDDEFYDLVKSMKPETLKAEKPKMMALIAMVDGVLTQMDQAESEEQMTQALLSIGALVKMAMGGK